LAAPVTMAVLPVTEKDMSSPKVANLTQSSDYFRFGRDA
jgi:hypothetical protein